MTIKMTHEKASEAERLAKAWINYMQYPEFDASGEPYPVRSFAEYCYLAGFRAAIEQASKLSKKDSDSALIERLKKLLGDAE
jgi:hypothetical protein